MCMQIHADAEYRNESEIKWKNYVRTNIEIYRLLVVPGLGLGLALVPSLYEWNENRTNQNLKTNKNKINYTTF